MRLVNVLTQPVHLKTSQQIMTVRSHLREGERGGRVKEEKGERSHLSVSKVKPLRQHSPPHCAINLLWRKVQPFSCFF